MSSNGKGKEAPDLGLSKKYSYRPPRIDAEAYQATIPDLVTSTTAQQQQQQQRPATESQPMAPPAPAPSHHHRTRKATGKLVPSKILVLPGEGDSPGDKKGGGDEEPASSAASVAGSEKDDSSVSLVPPSLPISLRPHQASLQEDLVWDPSSLDPASVDEYLIFVRNVMEHTLGGNKPWKKNGRSEVQPLESDRSALEFLQLHGGNLAAAELQLLSELGIKKEHAYFEALDNLCPSGASARGLESRDRSCLMGAFQSGVPGSSSAKSRAAKYQYHFSRSNSEDGGGESNSGSSSSGGDKKKRGTDRSEIKKMWTSLESRAKAVKAKCVENGRVRGGVAHANKVRFMDIHVVIREATSLPPLESIPGDPTSKTLDDILDDLRERAAQARKYIAMVHDALNTTAGEPSTLEELQRLLTTIRGQPILLEEDALVENVIRQAEQWQKRAKELVDNLDKGTTSELDVKTLLLAARSLPVRFESKTLLESRLTECEALGKEIRAALPQKSRNVIYQKLETLVNLREKALALKVTFAEGEYLDKVVKRTQQWCAEAKGAVSQSPDLKKLHTLLAEAGNIPVDLSAECAELTGKVDQAAKWVEKVRKALPKKNKTRRTGEVSKVDYTAARSLLSEGNDMRVDVKELEHIAGALSTAEEWLQRVREALEDATDATSLQSLESLLVEADDIPVVMEEHKILAAEIEARKWALKVQPRLESSKLTPEELTTVIEEATQLRSRLPITPRHQKNWKIPQEVEARRILDIVQGWMAKFRKCLVNPNSAPLAEVKESGRRGSSSSSSSSSPMVLKRNVALSTLEELVEESRDIPANLTECVSILEGGVSGVKSWYETWKDLLQACRLADGDAMEVDDPPPPTTTPKVELHQVAQCVSAGEAVGLELPEVEKLKRLIQRVNAWVEHVGNACPQRLSKRKSRAKATLSEVRQLLEEGTHFPVDVQEEANKVRARLEATAEWQQQCQVDLMSLNKEAEDHLARFEAALEARSKKEGEDEEDEEVDELLALEEVRLKKFEELKDKAGDVVIDTPEEEIVTRHLQAHKWFEDVAGVLLYDSKEISEDHIIEAEEAIAEGEKLLGIVNENKKGKKGGKRKSKANDEQEDGEEEASGAGDDATGAEASTEADLEAGGDEASKGKEKDEDGESSAMAQDEDKEESPKEEGEEEQEVEEEKPVEKTPCEEALDRLLKRWWDKLESHRKIVNVSSAWRARASKAIGSEKVKLVLLEELIEEASEFDFELEQLKKVKNEYQKAKSIQSRAAGALEGSPKLELPALKSLIGEGDKCKVQMDEVKALKKHLTAGQKWMQRFEKARDDADAGAPDQLPELKALYEEAEDLRIDVSKELPDIERHIHRCCLCRGMKEGDLVRCTTCNEPFHSKCLRLDDSLVNRFICHRCLVRRHLDESAQNILNILVAQLDLKSKDETGSRGSHSFSDDNQFPGLGNPKQKVLALMKRAVQALRHAIEGGPEAIKDIAKGVQGCPFLEVPRLVINDKDFELTDYLWKKYPEAQDLAHEFLKVIWACKMLYQLRRRPARNVLHSQLIMMENLDIKDPSLKSMLTELHGRATQWIERLKDLVRSGRLDEESGLDVEGLKRLLDEKKNIPVMVKEEGRALQILDEGGARWCHCKGFYDGSSMIECSTCKNWFHSRCVGIKKEEVAKINYNCVDCCRKKGNKYHYPDYRPPDQELIGDGGEDDDEENAMIKVETPEILMADTKSLEGLWPPLDLVLKVEESLADVDCSPAVFAQPKKKKMVGMGGPPFPPYNRPVSGKDRYKKEGGTPIRHPPHFPEGMGWPGDLPYRTSPDSPPMRGAWSRYGDEQLSSREYERLALAAGARPRPSKKKRSQFDDEDYDEDDYEKGQLAEWEDPLLRPAAKKAKRPAAKPPSRPLSNLDYLAKLDDIEASFTPSFRGGPKDSKIRRRVDPRDRLDDDRLGLAMRRMDMERGLPLPSDPHRHHLPPPPPPHHQKLYSFSLDANRYPGLEVGGRHSHSSSTPYMPPYHHLPPPPPPPPSNPGMMYPRAGGGGGHRHPSWGGGGGGYDRLPSRGRDSYRHGGERVMEGGGKGRRPSDAEAEDDFDD